MHFLADMTPLSATAPSKMKTGANQVQRCPRCDSMNTKFCYYNNYSFTQPRYFCKGCKRYWTKGGSIRNVPYGGGFRRNKKSSSSSGGQKSREATGNKNFVEKSLEAVPIVAVPTTSADYSTTITSCECFPSAGNSIPPKLPDPSAATWIPQYLLGSSATGYMQFPCGSMAPVMNLSDAAMTSYDRSPNAVPSSREIPVTSVFLALAGEEGEERIRKQYDLKHPFSSSIDVDSFVYNRQGSGNVSLSIPGNNVFQLDGLYSMDFSSFAFNHFPSRSLNSPEQKFMDRNKANFTQTSQDLIQSDCAPSLILPSESTIICSAGLNFPHSSTMNCRLRACNCGDNLQQQQEQLESKPCYIMPADQIVIDEHAWRYLIQDASTEPFDCLVLSSSDGSHTEVGNVAFEAEACSDGYFDPTNDLCYMGGPRIWSDFPLSFGIGSDLT